MFERLDEKLKAALAAVQKPGRYTGGEPGCVYKEKEKLDLRFAFCFPDTYEVGMSFLGMKILYEILNKRDNIWCERVFMPWVDMKEQMQQRDIPLYALESKDPLGMFDVVGFTLQYELSYTNILAMLDLAHIPFYAKDRGEDAPFIVAGGPCVCNAEPLADFFDLMMLGEGEAEYQGRVMPGREAMAAAGIDIDELMKGAADAMERFSVLSPDNDAYKYAAIRNILYRKGKVVETLAAFEPDFTMMNEWYKQLFGESEGKDQKGLMPTSCIFSTDLHSMGQFLQDGSRTMFETYVDIKNTREDFYIEPLEGNFDGLNFLADQNMSVVNRKAMEGTILAHNDGGVPIGVIEVDSLDAYNVGYLIYFFWKACAVSGYLLSVNPFDQPGVESYKKNMFALLGKPGYEDRKAELEAKLG